MQEFPRVSPNLANIIFTTWIYSKIIFLMSILSGFYLPWIFFSHVVATSTARNYPSSYSVPMQRWEYGTSAEVRSSPVVGNNGTIYVGSNDGSIYAIGRNGNLFWKFQTNAYNEDGVYSSPAVSLDGNIYFGSADKYFYSLAHNGSLIWKYRTQGLIFHLLLSTTMVQYILDQMTITFTRFS